MESEGGYKMGFRLELAEGRCGLYRNAPGVNLAWAPLCPPPCDWPNMKTLCPFPAISPKVPPSSATKIMITDPEHL